MQHVEEFYRCIESDRVDRIEIPVGCWNRRGRDQTYGV